MSAGQFLYDLSPGSLPVQLRYFTVQTVWGKGVFQELCLKRMRQLRVLHWEEIMFLFLHPKKQQYRYSYGGFLDKTKTNVDNYNAKFVIIRHKQNKLDAYLTRTLL